MAPNVVFAASLVLENAPVVSPGSMRWPEDRGRSRSPSPLLGLACTRFVTVKPVP